MNIFKSISAIIFKKKENILLEFAKANNVTYEIGQYDNEDFVKIIYKNIEIIFDSYIDYQTAGNVNLEKKYNRVRCEYKIINSFQFKIVTQGIFESITKIFGKKDIKIGDNKFDTHFMVSGNEEYKIQTIFSNPIIKSVLLSYSDVLFEIFEKEGLFNEKISENNFMLYFLTEDKITNVEQLHDLNKLFIETINEMIKINAIKFP